MTGPAERKPIKRHTVSELDGTQQGGLAFVIALLGGMVVAAALVPGALTSFWIWCAILMLAVAVARGVRSVFARVEPEEVTQ